VGGAQVRGERTAQLLVVRAVEGLAQRFLQVRVASRVVQLQPSAVRAVVIQLAFLTTGERIDAFGGPVGVGRVLGLRRAQRNHVQRRVGRIRFDRELGHGLIGGVQHIGAPRRSGVGENPGDVEPVGEVGVVGLAPPIV